MTDAMQRRKAWDSIARRLSQPDIEIDPTRTPRYHSTESIGEAANIIFNARMGQLEEENERLRELVKAFNWCTENFDMFLKCDSCPLQQSSTLECECDVMMRELGIEVS